MKKMGIQGERGENGGKNQLSLRIQSHSFSFCILVKQPYNLVKEHLVNLNFQLKWFIFACLAVQLTVYD